MPSPPSPLDDSGNLPSIGRDRNSRQAGHPNYLFRRAITVAGVVAAIALGAIVVGRIVGGDTPAPSSGAVSEQWNRVVLIDERTGLITINNAEGEEQRKISTDIRLLADSEVVETTMMAISPTEVSIFDLESEAVETVELETSSDGITRPAGSALTLIASSEGAQRAVLVHGPTGEQLDTDALAPSAGARYEFRLARSDPSGRNVLVTDSGNFQSVLFSFDSDSASFFPGLALAIDPSFVVTTQNVGSDATVRMFNHDGEVAASGVTSSVRAAMIVDDGVILVTVDGEIVRLSKASGDTESGDTLEIGTIENGYVATDGNQLIVVGSSGTAIINSSGSIQGQYLDTTLSDNGLDRFAPRRSTCLILVRGSANEVVLVGLADGTTIAEAPVSGGLLATADGCTIAAGTSTGYSLISADGEFSVDDTGDLLAFAPDGSALILERDSRLQLAPVDPSPEANSGERTNDSIDLGRDGRQVSFTQL
ncbi:MAG: hypothetical protein GXP35_16410 [Actinobacteria bacterium]|nr:hypothetical protein [Actinomycetota bacterium]